MRRPPSPVTPMYHTNFGNFASLDMKHHAGPTGPPGLPLFKTMSPGHAATGQQLPPHQFPHSNSHYVEQNPFIVSPMPALSVTAATAAAVKRNIVSGLYNYNPSSEPSTPNNPYER